MRCFRAYVYILIVVVLYASKALAQQQPTLPAPAVTNPGSGENILNFFSARTPYEFWLTCVIGFIGLCIIGFIVFAVRTTQHVRAEDVTRPVVVVTIIFGTLILITAGYSNQQVAPAFGLFGTIVGYLLGRLGQPTTSTTSQTDTAGDVPPQARADQQTNQQAGGG